MASARVCNLFLANGRCRISSQLLFNNPGRAPTGCRTFAIQTALLQRWKFPFIVTALCRKYTTAPPNSSEQLAVKDLVLPNLMDVPVKDIVKRRSILKSIYCYLFSSFYHAFNSAFHIRDFWEQVPQTIEVVSQHLAKQEYAKLHDYVRADVLRDLKHHIDQMTEEQRRQIALRRVDIFRKYVVWMKHVYPKLDRPDNDTYLEVTAVFHVRKELPKDVKTLSELMQRFPRTDLGYQAGDTICMYRFRKNFFCLPGTDPRWTVTLLNHVRVEDIKARRDIEAKQKRANVQTDDISEHLAKA